MRTPFFCSYWDRLGAFHHGFHGFPLGSWYQVHSRFLVTQGCKSSKQVLKCGVTLHVSDWLVSSCARSERLVYKNLNRHFLKPVNEGHVSNNAVVRACDEQSQAEQQVQRRLNVHLRCSVRINYVMARGDALL